MEAVAALRALAGSEPRITLLAPDTSLTPRAASVAAPFGLGAPSPLPFDAIRRRAPFDLHRGTLAHVEPDAHVAVTAEGERIGYDKLLVAVGARPMPAVPGALSFGGPGDAPAVARAIEATAKLAFVVPSASGWSLPVYELAIMAAVDAARPRRRAGDHCRHAGARAAVGVRRRGRPRHRRAARTSAGSRCARARVRSRPRAGALEVDFGPDVPAERVIALARLCGPAIAGLPASSDGFIPVDDHGRVDGRARRLRRRRRDDVPAQAGRPRHPAGRRGRGGDRGRARRAVEPTPFRPVLRGLLLTGGEPLYLRAALSPAGEVQDSQRAPHAERGPPPRSRAARCGGRRARSPAATSRRCWPRPARRCSRRQLQDYRPSPTADARDLALLLADEEAAMGDYAQALRALDAAASLAGGELPPEWTERRETWMTAHRHSLA